MRLAFFSDVHSNLPALDAVLADMDRAGVDGRYALVIVCGHTHRPYDKTVGAFRFINDGSAGQAKDGDPRACWALPHEFAAQVREARGYQVAA